MNKIHFNLTSSHLLRNLNENVVTLTQIDPVLVHKTNVQVLISRMFVCHKVVYTSHIR